MYREGLYFGNSVADLFSAEQTLGGDVDMIAIHTGRASWADWIGSIGWQIGNMSAATATHDMRWSIPMFANGGTLQAAASHAYDSYYVQAAQKLAAAYAGDDHIIVRVGEEFNGSWMPWSAAGHEADYAQAYRNFVDAFRSVSDKFQFEWNINVGTTGTDVAAAYPGDSYVDYIGGDFYWDSKQSWSITDPQSAFNYIKTTTYGLQWLENFAAAHGKQTAYSEWGVNSPNASEYINLVKQWFDGHNVAYEIYWDSNADFAGKLTGGELGTASTTFEQLFGDLDSVTSAIDTVLKINQHDLTLTGTHILSGTGNALDNVLTASAAGSLLHGLDGNDTLVSGAGSDLLDGGAGVDTASYAAATAGVTVNLGLATPQDTHGAGIDTLLGIENLTGSAFADTLTGDIGDNILTGGYGDDTISGGYGNDTIYGNQGNDLLFGNQGNDTIYGGQGDDIIYGGQGDDVLHGNLGNDVLEGGLGNDLIYGDDGIDTAAYTQATAGVTVSLLLQGHAQDTGVTGFDTLVGIENLTGSSYDDVLTGDAGDNVLTGGAGNDTLIGGYGNDTLYGNDGNDILYGNQGNDTLIGGEGNNMLYGGQGDDILIGGSGSDMLQGGVGADILTGGAGADIFRFVTLLDSTTAAPDRITDFETGTDKIDLSALHTLATDHLYVQQTATGALIGIDAGGDGTIDFLLNVTGKVAAGDILWNGSETDIATDGTVSGSTADHAAATAAAMADHFLHG